MSHRCLFLIAALLTNISTGFTQTLGDIARAERARREVLARRATSDMPAKDVPATVVGREALIKEALRVSGAKRQLERVLETSLPTIANGPVPKGVSAQEYRRLVNDTFDAEHLMPAMEKSLKRHDKIRLYYELGSRFPGAGWDDLEDERPAVDAPVHLVQHPGVLLVDPHVVVAVAVGLDVGGDDGAAHRPAGAEHLQPDSQRREVRSCSALLSFCASARMVRRSSSTP